MNAVIKLSSPETREFWEIPVLWEDAWLLALDKPSGLLTSPDRLEPDRPNLIRLLQRDIERGAGWARQRGMSYLADADSLDREASGVVLLAKEKRARLALGDQFGSGTVLKTYVALVQQSPAENLFEVAAKLAPHPVQTGFMRVDEKRGKKSHTVFEVRERFAGYTLLECRPRTARTHQIRVHLRHAGLPVVGDVLYGSVPLLLSRLKSSYRLKRDEVEHPLLVRPGLHAEQLVVRHPTTDAPVTIASPWPKDFAVAVKYLRRFAA